MCVWKFNIIIIIASNYNYAVPHAYFQPTQLSEYSNKRYNIYDFCKYHKTMDARLIGAGERYLF